MTRIVKSNSARWSFSKWPFSSSVAHATSTSAGAANWPAHARQQRALSESESAWWRYGSWLTGSALLLCALALCLPRMPVPASYHAFADQMTWGVLPHARDVLSNAAFALAGWVLWWQGRRYVRCMPDEAARQRLASALRVSAWGLVLTALCSGIYHLQPDARGLMIDRIGMSMAFAGVVGVLVADRFAPVRVVPAMAAALLLGVACAVGDFLHDNTMPWVLFQLGVVLLMLLAPWVTRDAGTHRLGQPAVLGVAWWQVLAFYALAKLCEMGDHALWHWTGEIISGHSLKHIAAAAAVWPIVRALRQRALAARAQSQ